MELGWGAGWAEGREEEPVGPLGKKRENTPLGRTRGIGSVLFLLIYIYIHIFQNHFKIGSKIFINHFEFCVQKHPSQ